MASHSLNCSLWPRQTNNVLIVLQSCDVMWLIIKNKYDAVSRMATGCPVLTIHPWANPSSPSRVLSKPHYWSPATATANHQCSISKKKKEELCSKLTVWKPNKHIDVSFVFFQPQASKITSLYFSIFLWLGFIVLNNVTAQHFNIVIDYLLYTLCEQLN